MACTKLGMATGGLALLAAVPAGAAPACSPDGARYTARTSAPFTDTVRLVTEPLPRSAPAAAVATLWRFQLLSRGRQVGELRMQYGCPNGGGACTVSLPSAPAGPSSEVVRLNRDFSPVTGDDAPYALVLPGFATASWVWTLDQLKSPDLTLPRGAEDGPDLSDRYVWVLSACGGAARRSR